MKIIKPKDLFNIAKSYRYDLLHKQSAIKALKNIEKEKGELSEDIISACDEYAKSYLGDIKYAPWLYVYSAIQGEFKEGWIPDNYYGRVIVNNLDGVFKLSSEMKPLTKTILQTSLLPDLLYVHNGLFIDAVSHKVLSEKEAYSTLFDKNETVIFKSNNSQQGLGVVTYTAREWSASTISNQSGVFQKIIKQHDFFNNIFPYPGATIRVTTGLNDSGEATVRSAYLRLGRSDDKSQHVQSRSAIKIAIDTSSGELFSVGYFSDWSSTKTHPDTGVAFEGLVVPGFKDACLKIESLHNKYPFVQSIGWDISINSEEEVEVMEWNTAHNDIKFSEAMHGPCFQDILSRSVKK